MCFVLRRTSRRFAQFHQMLKLALKNWEALITVDQPSKLFALATRYIQPPGAPILIETSTHPPAADQPLDLPEDQFTLTDKLHTHRALFHAADRAISFKIAAQKFGHEAYRNSGERQVSSLARWNAHLGQIFNEVAIVYCEFIAGIRGSFICQFADRAITQKTLLFLCNPKVWLGNGNRPPLYASIPSYPPEQPSPPRAEFMKDLRKTLTLPCHAFIIP